MHLVDFLEKMELQSEDQFVVKGSGKRLSFCMPGLIVRPLGGNDKTGITGVTLASINATCGECPIPDKCYGRTFPLSLHSKRLDEEIAGTDVSPEAMAYREAYLLGLCRGEYPMRVHVIGDVQTAAAAAILGAAMVAYTARMGQPCWAYTHQWRNIPIEDWQGAYIIASCETYEQTLEARELGYVTAVIVAKHGDSRYIDCLQQTTGKQCADCLLCARKVKKPIAFAAHGHAKKALAEMVSSRRGVYGSRILVGHDIKRGPSFAGLREAKLYAEIALHDSRDMMFLYTDAAGVEHAIAKENGRVIVVR